MLIHLHDKSLSHKGNLTTNNLTTFAKFTDVSIGMNLPYFSHGTPNDMKFSFSMHLAA